MYFPSLQSRQRGPVLGVPERYDIPGENFL